MEQAMIFDVYGTLVSTGTGSVRPDRILMGLPAEGLLL